MSGFFRHWKLFNLLQARENKPLLISQHHSHHFTIVKRQPRIDLLYISNQYRTTHLCITLYGNERQYLSQKIIVGKDPMNGKDSGPETVFCWITFCNCRHLIKHLESCGDLVSLSIESSKIWMQIKESCLRSCFPKLTKNLINILQ